MKIRRDIIDRLKQWKDSENRKPVLLKGARQTGKTWIMEEFGKECFEYVAIFNFDKVEELASVFEKTKDVQRILKELALFTDVPIEAGKTLLVFDEIQLCEGALNSLKYFCEDAPQYHIIAAGSLLGVAIRKKKMSVPVGKVQILRMYPVTFKEFLQASDERTYQYVNSLEVIEPLPDIILSKLELEYKRYLVCGGMPEAVTALLGNRGGRLLMKPYRIYSICIRWIFLNMLPLRRFHVLIAYGLHCHPSWQRRTASFFIASSVAARVHANTRTLYYGWRRPDLFIVSLM